MAPVAHKVSQGAPLFRIPVTVCSVLNGHSRELVASQAGMLESAPCAVAIRLSRSGCLNHDGGFSIENGTPSDGLVSAASAPPVTFLRPYGGTCPDAQPTRRRNPGLNLPTCRGAHTLPATVTADKLPVSVWRGYGVSSEHALTAITADGSRTRRSEQSINPRHDYRLSASTAARLSSSH